MAKMYIGGQCGEGKGPLLDVICPATGVVIDTIRTADGAQVDEALNTAQDAFYRWSHTSLNERIGWMLKLRDACLAEKDVIVDLMAREGGKSYLEAGNDFQAFINYFGFYSEEAKRISGNDLVEVGAARGAAFNALIKRPIGVVVGYLAWNMPASNLGLKMCPSMASGCTCILRPSTQTPLAALKIGELAEKIGLPAGVVNILTGPAEVLGAHLSGSAVPAMISVIGSSAVGLEVMRQGATSIKKYSMELGGNAPCIIMPDVDVDAVARFVAGRKVRISGQGCANINRIFVHESLHDAFVEALLPLVRDIQVGWSPEMPKAMGPLINLQARDRMLALVRDAVARGARLLYGGVVPELPDNLKNGAFFVPAVLDGVTDDMRVAAEEVFGPIYSILTFRELDEVIERSNNTPLGLTGFLFTHDARVMGRCIEDLQVGELQINFPAGFANANMPHIGIKQSGLGCDRGAMSLEEYYSVRRIAIQP